MSGAERQSDEGPRAGRWGTRRFKWLLLLGLLLLGALVSVSSIRVEQYVTSDPTFCNSCHVASTNAVHSSAHKNQPCSTCHRNDFRPNLKQWVFAQVSKARVEHGAFEPAACKGCHAKGGLERWQLSWSREQVVHVIDARSRSNEITVTSSQATDGAQAEACDSFRRHAC